MHERAARDLPAEAGERLSPVFISTLAIWALAWREIIRFLRQPSRVVGSIGTPLVFWLLFGAGLQGSFRTAPTGGEDFRAYFLPGATILIVMFTSVFASISLIEDRREGFLQGVLVSPVPRLALVLGKVLGGTILAVGQGLIFLLLAPTMGVGFPWSALPLAIVALVVASASLTAFGFAAAWLTDSTQGFHTIMNLVLMPMWLLSGAFFPMPAWSESMGAGQMALHIAMRANPLMYAVAALRSSLLASDPAAEGSFYRPDAMLSWGVSIGFAALALAAAWCVVLVRKEGDR